MKKIAVLISGSGSNLEAIINACNSNNIDGTVISVICNDPKAYGIERAKNLNIEVRIINHKEFIFIFFDFRVKWINIIFRPIKITCF